MCCSWGPAGTPAPPTHQFTPLFSHRVGGSFLSPGVLQWGHPLFAWPQQSFRAGPHGQAHPGETWFGTGHPWSSEGLCKQLGMPRPFSLSSPGSVRPHRTGGRELGNGRPVATRPAEVLSLTVQPLSAGWRQSPVAASSGRPPPRSFILLVFRESLWPTDPSNCAVSQDLPWALLLASGTGDPASQRSVTCAGGFHAFPMDASGISCLYRFQDTNPAFVCNSSVSCLNHKGKHSRTEMGRALCSWVCGGGVGALVDPAGLTRASDSGPLTAVVRLPSVW